MLVATSTLKVSTCIMSVLSLCWLAPCSCVLQSKDSCPLWHILNEKGNCECADTLDGFISCNKKFVYIVQGNCLTWNNLTGRAELYPCLFGTLWDSKHICRVYNDNDVSSYRVSVNISGESLNHITCGGYNRKGAQCKQCIDGYGPAAFADGVTCADCSKHKHLWILNLMFQLTMVTLMYIIFIPLQISAVASPHNVIIVYTQLTAMTLKFYGTLRIIVACLIGETYTKILITVLDVWNLDFFRLIIPPLCINASLKSINILLLDYIIAIYPLAFSAVIYVCIEFYDRNNRLVVFLSSPIRKCFNSTWNPRRTILNTFITFFLLSYSKFLFVSINLISTVQIYNSQGKTDTKVLLYDPTIRYFHSEHIPYVILAITILVVFNLVPPLFLLLYPTKPFRKCLQLLKIRWDIVSHIMDIFQGWYKDGTEGTRDYRFISGFYFLLRIGLVCQLVAMLLMAYRNSWIWGVPVPGITHFMLGVFFFTVKPYKKAYMNHMDGLIFTLFGAVFYIWAYDIKALYIIGAAFVCLLGALSLTYAIYMCIKKRK